MTLIYEYGIMSLVDTGAFFSGRDHTTVIYARKRVKMAMACDERINEMVQSIKDSYQERQHAKNGDLSES